MKNGNKIIILLLIFIIILVGILAFRMYTGNNTDNTQKYSSNNANATSYETINTSIDQNINETEAIEQNAKYQNILNRDDLTDEEKETIISGMKEEEQIRRKNQELKNKMQSLDGVYSNSGVRYIFITTYIMAIVLLLIIPIISIWKIFNDQGIPGWQSIVPILNIYRMFQIAGIPGYCVLIIFIPYIGEFMLLIFNIIFAYRLAQLYGKGIGYTLGLLLLPFIFYPLLAFKK